MSIPFRFEYPFKYARLETVSPLIRRVVARNPGPFTFHGTATFIVGHGAVAIIDPGPSNSEHIETLVASLKDETVTHIFVTHTHPDHSPASRAVADLTGAKIFGCAAHGSGARGGVVAGGDTKFRADVVMSDGDTVHGAGWSIEAVHTPGHTSNHLCFSFPQEKTLFSGDHVMGWSTTVIVPPDGHLGDYLVSLQRLLTRDEQLYRPTHGPPIERPQAFVRAIHRHRQLRLQQLRERLKTSPLRIDQLLPLLYPELDQRLIAAAARSTFAGLIYLIEGGKVGCDAETATLDSHFYLLEPGK